MGLCGAACAAVAKSNGRNPVGWFLVGALTFGIGLVPLFAFPDLKKEEAVKKRLDEEGRVVREAVEKERKLAHARHPETLKRLRDTDRTTEGQGEKSSDSQVASELDQPYQNSNWFHEIDGEHVGPQPFETLHLTWLAEAIDGKTLVWRKGMDVWLAIDDLDGMSKALDG